MSMTHCKIIRKQIDDELKAKSGNRDLETEQRDGSNDGGVVLSKGKAWVRRARQ